MDDLFDRQLRVGLRALIDPVTGEYPRWEASPAAERVRRLPAHPRFGPWLGSGMDRRVAWSVAAAALLLLALVGFVFTTGSAPVTPVPPSCPAGSSPDEPGPIDQERPAATDFAGPIVWDSAARRLLLLPDGRTPAWTFDVCANTWHAMKAETTTWWRPPGAVVYDEDSDRTVAIGDNLVEAYDLESDVWVPKGRAPMWIAQAAFDPLSGNVLVRDEDASRLWSYDVDTNAWLEMPQGPLLPPDEGNCGFQFLDYDQSVDRIVFYVEVCRSTGPEIWLFDPRAGSWSKAAGATPRIELFIGNDQMVFDSVNARSVVYAGGRVAAYDAMSNEWEVLFDAGPGTERFFRVENAYAFDPLNARLVAVGGRVRMGEEWRATDDVVAFDVRTRTWTELLAPTGDQAREPSPAASVTPNGGGQP
jgi:hypothetical protein